MRSPQRPGEVFSDLERSKWGENMESPVLNLPEGSHSTEMVYLLVYTYVPTC
jgi:hypothetical protein